MLGSGCREHPDIRFETEHTLIGTFFDHEVCRGSLLQIESWAVGLEEEFGIHPEDKRTIYWGIEGVDEWCSGGLDGCYIGDERLIVGSWSALEHEMVHATRSRDERPNTFVEEGLAEALTTARLSVGAGDPPISELMLRPQDEFERDGGRNTAGHFIRFLRDEYGIAEVLRLRDQMPYSPSSGRADETIEQVFGLALGELQEEWLVNAPETYVLEDDSLPDVVLDDQPILFDEELDCDSPTTFGPLTGSVLDEDVEQPGMHELLVLDVVDTTLVRFRLQSSSASTVASMLRRPGCWQQATSDAPAEFEILPDQEFTVELAACRWTIDISDSGYSPVDYTLSISPVRR